MNKRAELRIGHTPWRYAAGRLEIPGLDVIDGSPWELRVGKKKWPLVHVRPEEGPHDPAAFAEYAKKSADNNALPIVLAPYIREDVRVALESAGVSYFDFHGNVYLDTPEFVVLARTPVVQELTRTLGVVGVRGAQTVLAEPNRMWGVIDLARAARMSAGQAQNVMKTLEAETLVYTDGRGPQKKRGVTDPGRFLDWLNQLKAGREPRGKLSCSLYGRTPDAVWRAISSGLEGTEHAITGAAAAAILGVGPTSLARTIVRVASSSPLRLVAQQLGAESTERGANVVLWSDTGLLGVTGSVMVDRRMVAPNIRVYLDLHAELRGVDLASEFREHVIGY